MISQRLIPAMLPALTVALSMGTGQMAYAQTDPAPATSSGEATSPAPAPTLADLASDPALARAYQTMTDGHEMPAWISEGAVVTPGQPVRFGGVDYIAMTACKQHDCAANQIAMLYSPQADKAYGVLSVRDGAGAELLTWLNIGGGAESIDGRTILYAALTGSLANHPDAFAYPAE